MLARKRDATLRRLHAGAGDVHEDRAAAAFDARGLVVAEDDDHIVETIVPPKVLGTGRVGMAHAPIVVPVRGIVAPAIMPIERGDREPSARPRKPVAAIENLAQRKSTDGRCPIALALADPPPGSTQRTGKTQGPRGQNPPLRAGRKAPHDELRTRLWTTAS